VVSRLDRVSGGQAGPHEQWPKATQEGPSGLSLLRSDGSRDGQAGRLDSVSGGQKTLKALKGNYQTSVHSGHMVLMVVRQGGVRCISSGPSHSHNCRKTTIGSQGTQQKISKVTAQTRVNLLYLRGC
jgi:hypothetical protein